MARFFRLCALLTATQLASASASDTARVATSRELTALYPDFNETHFRIAGHRIGWTQVKAWPYHEGWEVIWVERLLGEGNEAPRDYELALLERGPPFRVVGRWVGFENHRSPGESTNGPRIVALDLGAFEVAEGDFALGAQTESKAQASQGRARTLTLFHLEPPSLKPILQVDRAGRGIKLVRRPGEAFRDLVLSPASGEGSEVRYRWVPGQGYQPMP